MNVSVLAMKWQMFSNYRKEKTEHLEGLVISDEEFTILHYPQVRNTFNLYRLIRSFHSDFEARF